MARSVILWVFAGVRKRKVRERERLASRRIKAEERLAVMVLQLEEPDSPPAREATDALNDCPKRPGGLTR